MNMTPNSLSENCSSRRLRRRGRRSERILRIDSKLNPLTRIRIPLAILLFLGFLLYLWTVTAQAAVTLVYFTASPQGNKIYINWETATEYDNAGFFVLRSLLENGQFERYSGFILAEGDGPTGALYEFIDEDVIESTMYYYKLEAIALDQTSEFFGPVSAYIGDPPSTPSQTPSSTSTKTSTPTGTKTSTSTPTKTPTSTASSKSTTAGGSPTPTRTPTRITSWIASPTRTPFPIAAPPTATPEITQDITSTLTTTSTEAVILPSETPTSTPSTSPDAAGATDKTSSSTEVAFVIQSDPQGQPGITNRFQSTPPGRTGLIIAIIVFWGILAFGLYYYLQQRNKLS